ncbi:DUF2066 domain-containing protein [Pelagibacteraceae bacterium]|jgi:hypothetical protein|nr:DUF2066 domain-containing protein [Pelagibacteraceae bacterium]|tara:strand:+ start:2174 stop:3214 length:1041 start_codon:yes stop_codon:yes gene_type:complete
MNKIIFTIFIIVCLFKTETLLSDNKNFNVDNISLDSKEFKSHEEMLNKAFKKGFNQLIKKILMKDDIIKLSTTSLKDIKELISTYQIVKSQNTENSKTLVNISFQSEKINRFFYVKNISYADISKTKVVLFPVLIQDNDFYLYTNNFLYTDWNKKNKIEEDNNFVNYILTVENLEDVQFINKNKKNLELTNIKKLITNYEIKNLVFLTVTLNKNKNENNIFLKSYIANNEVVKSFKVNSNIANEKLIKIIKNEIEEIWKSQNLIDVRTPSFLNIVLDIKNVNDFYNLQNILKQIKIIEKINVIEFNNKYAKIKIKYYGKIEKIKKKLSQQKIKVIITDNEWKLKLT